jgi:HAD superfamily hydrolase (TIGR01459 family)
VKATEYLQGVAEVLDRYDALLLDQWGVLHDGAKPYPGAVDCLEGLRAAGKTVVILSNSGRSGEENARFLVRMGIDRRLFGEVVSAGDDARDAILNSADPFYRALGRRCLVLARERDAHLIDGLGLEVVTDVAQAEFLFALSIDAPRQSVRGWEPVLIRAAARGLPMVCGNPDLAQVTPAGTLLEATGLLAVRYAELGGTVRAHGKPSPRIYETCLRRLTCPRERIVAVGDSLPHDVLGARGVGLASILVACGVHRETLGITFGESPDPARCAVLFAQAGAMPDHVLPSFRW